MTDTIILQSFPYLSGQTVQVCIGGLDCGDFFVDNEGNIEVPYGSDDGGLLTVDYLMGISAAGTYGDSETRIYITDIEESVFTAYVPVVVGYGYTSQGQLPRAVAQEEMKTPKGSGVGKMRRAFMFAMNVWNAVNGKVKVGTDFDHLQAQTMLYPDRATELPATTAFSGIIEDTLDDDPSFDGQLAWQVDRPVPLGVTAATAFENTEDR